MLTALENTLKEELTDYPSYLAKPSRKASLPGLLTKKPAKSYFREDGEYLELNDFTPDQPRQRYIRIHSMLGEKWIACTYNASNLYTPPAIILGICTLSGYCHLV